MLRLLVITSLILSPLAQADDKPISLIGFGSCAKQDKPQPILDLVTERKPDLFVYLGDNIYGDTEDMDLLRAKYAMLGIKPEYVRMKAATRIVATWDDHDFGIDDGGREYSMKEESKEIFLEFFDEPDDSPRRDHKGIYTAYEFGPVGKRVQLILLDLRTFRTPLARGNEPPAREHGGPYVPTDDPESVLLGEEQWLWLRKHLNAPADIRLIGSSIQFAAEFHGWEAWANFPKERERFITLVRETKASGVVLLSGDMHYGELSVMKNVLPYPLYDFTSSGINQVWEHDMENIHRLGDTEYRSHIGWIRFDWDQPNPEITFQLQVLGGEIGLEHTIRLDEITRP